MNGKTSLGHSVPSNNSLVNIGDLCRIIKECATYGVREVQFNGLHLIFGESDQPPKILNRLRPNPSSKKAKTITDEAHATELADRVFQDLEELKLTDPLSYEKLLEGELGDVGSTS